MPARLRERHQRAGRSIIPLGAEAALAHAGADLRLQQLPMRRAAVPHVPHCSVSAQFPLAAVMSVYCGSQISSQTEAKALMADRPVDIRS